MDREAETGEAVSCAVSLDGVPLRPDGDGEACRASSGTVSGADGTRLKTLSFGPETGKLNALPKRLVPPRTNAREPEPPFNHVSRKAQERRFILRKAEIDPANSGSSKTHEAKLVVVWTAEKLNEEIPERGSVSYSAASAATLDIDKELSPFAQRVDRKARRRG